MPRFTAVIQDSAGSRWEEVWDIPKGRDPVKWGDAIVSRWNSSLRPGETHRRVVDLWESAPIEAHQWEKSSLVTQEKDGAIFDAYRCRSCGITGKRFGLSASVKRDWQFRAKHYEVCNKEDR